MTSKDTVTSSTAIKALQEMIRQAVRLGLPTEELENQLAKCRSVTSPVAPNSDRDNPFQVAG